MKNINRIVITLIFSLIIPGTTFAQPKPNITAEAMLKFGWTVGRWQGDAWFMTGENTKQYLKQTEIVRLKHKGTIILFEGNAVDVETDPNYPKIIYEEMKILNFDTVSNKYFIHAFIEGRSIKSEAIPNKNFGFDWEFETPSGKIKHSIGLDKDKNWKETRHISHDEGKTWIQNSEVVLKSVFME